MHTPTVEPWMLLAGVLVMLAILATRLSARLGVPALTLFLATGMFFGSDGPGGIWFDDPALTWSVGTVALAVLLYAAGMETPLAAVRAVVGPGLVLATVGVAASAGLTALFYHHAFGRPLGEGFLLGAIVSSTDAAAVFGVLRASGLHLRGRIQPLLEMESGSNDPVAILLTLAASAALVGQSPAVGSVLLGMGGQLVLGVTAGLLGGRGIAWAANRLRVPQEGLTPVFVLAAGLALFGLTALLHGSGYLAVYVAGLGLGAAPLLRRRAILRFHDALAWLAQIGTFVLLGLLVFPSRLPGVAAEGLAVAAFLLFVARPLSVLLALGPFGVPLREQAMVAWVGLRGAVPIVLATWPRVLGVPGAEEIFDVVFFVVLVSVLVQGTSLPWVARRLGVAEPLPAAEAELDAAAGEGRGARTVRVAVGPALEGRRLLDAGLPAGALVALVERDGAQIVPQGGTLLHAGDVVLVVVQVGQEAAVRGALEGPPVG